LPEIIAEKLSIESTVIMHHQFLSLIAIVVAISVQTATAKPIPVTQGNTAKPTGENPLSSSIECASSPEFSPQSQYPLLAWTGCDGDGRLRVQKRQLTVPYVSNEIWHGGSG